MSRHHSHIASAAKVLETLVPGEPLVHHLKKFFSANKKYGSKDRKMIAALCYNFFRAGKALDRFDTETKLLYALFLCTDQKNDLLAALRPDLNNDVTLPVDKKIALLELKVEDIFWPAEELSDEIEKEDFIVSLLKQPLLYLRVRPGKEIKVQEKLGEAKIEFEEVSTSCLALPSASKITEIIKLNKEAVVQDRSSQLVFDYLKSEEIFLPKDVTVWDCCAASGGKSILLHDILHGHLRLTVSDVRENIMHNLRNRFEDAGIKNYDSFVADLTQENAVTKKKYELIVCDAPCSGSGTWSRTPEQLAFFKPEDIDKYVGMQKAIASTAVECLQKDGLFFYITCSVFKKENEEVVEFLKNKFDLQVMQAEYIKGYHVQADTMFAAVLKK